MDRINQSVKVAIGPVMNGFGSWEWVGKDTAQQLARRCEVEEFSDADTLANVDVVIFVKFKPRLEVLQKLSQQSSIIYCPIDFYGSGREIDADAQSLLCCDTIVIHGELLRKYFAGYANVTYIDHHLKFATVPRPHFVESGPLLWAGVRSNLEPVIDWVNRHDLPEEVWILTNPENPECPPTADELGFTTKNRVRIGVWSPQRHCEWTTLARAAFDVKGEEFRARYKPPAKALDFLASGVPLAMNADSGVVRQLRLRNVNLATLDDMGYWLSREYWETIRCAAAILQETLSLDRIVSRWEDVIRNACR